MKLQTTSTTSPASRARRRNDRTLCSQSAQSIHSNPAGLDVELVERGLGAVEPVQVAHEPLQAAVVRALVEQMPVEAPVVVPLAPLAELAAHEQQLLAGCAHMKP